MSKETLVTKYGDKSVFINENNAEIRIYSALGEVKVIQPGQDQLDDLRKYVGEGFNQILATIRSLSLPQLAGLFSGEGGGLPAGIGYTGGPVPSAIRLISKTGDQLRPDDLLAGPRAMQFNEYKSFYFLRQNVDYPLQLGLSKRKSILVHGPIISGKTTAVFQLLKNKYPEAQVHIARKWDIKDNDLRWQQSIDNLLNDIENKCDASTFNVFVFDDIRNFIERDSNEAVDYKWELLQDIINRVHNKKSALILTCRSEDFEHVRNKMGEYVGTFVVPLAIKELNDLESKALELNIKNEKFNIDLDRNRSKLIGSYFMGFNEIRAKYQKLSELEKSYLWCIKCNYYLRKANREDQQFIEDYFRLKNKLVPEESLQQVVQSLEQSKFIERYTETVKTVEGEKTDRMIRVDNAYLQSVILHRENEQTMDQGSSLLSDFYETIASREEELLIEDICKTYAYSLPETQREVYNRLLLRVGNQARSKSKKKEIYQRFRSSLLEKIDKGLGRDIFTFNALIFRSADAPQMTDGLTENNEQDSAWIYYKQLKEQYPAERPNQFTLNFLIKRTKNHREALKIYQEIVINYNAEPDVYTFRGLLAKCRDFSEAWFSYEMFRELHERNPEEYLNTYIYYNLLGKAKNFDEAYRIFTEIERINSEYDKKNSRILIRLNINFYLSLIRKPGGDFNDAWGLYTVARGLHKSLSMDRKNGNLQQPSSEKDAEIMQIDYFTLTRLIQKCTKIEQAELVFHEVRELNMTDLKPTIYTNLMKQYSDQKQRQKIFDSMVDKQIKPTIESYNTLMELAAYPEETDRLLAQMTSENGVGLDEYSFYNLIKKEDSFARKWAYFEEMMEPQHDLSPHLTVINHLLGKMKPLPKDEQYERAKDIFQIVIEKDVIHQTSRNDDAVERKNGVRSFYSLLRGKLRTVTDKLSLIMYVSSMVDMSDKDFMVSMRLSQTNEEVDQIFKLMYGLKVTVGPSFAYTYVRNIVVQSQTDDMLIIQFMDAMRRLKFELAAEDEVLLQIAGIFIRRRGLSNQKIMDICTLIKNMGIQLSTEIIDHLFGAILESQKNMNIPEAVTRIEPFCEGKFKPTAAFFVGIMKRWKSYSALKSLYNNMVQNHIQPSPYTFHIMLEKAIDSSREKINSTDRDWMKNINDIFKEISQREQVYTHSLFELLIKKGLHRESSKSLSFVLSMIRKYKINLSEELAARLFADVLKKKNNDVEEAFKVVKGIEYLEKDRLEYSLLFQNISSKILVNEVQHHLLEQKQVISDKAYRSLVWLSSPNEIHETYNLRLQNLSPTIGPILIKRSNYAEAFKFYEAFKSNSWPIHDFIYYELIRKAPSFMDAWRLYMEIREVKKTEIRNRGKATSGIIHCL